MPTYEYLCKNCGQQFDVFQSFSAKPLKKHDVCGGEVQKVFHARGVVFKGSGFYVTDSKASKSSMKAPGASSSSESGATSESKSESKSEPKGQSKSEAKSSDSSASKSSSSSSDD